jgi:capsular polysaccharide biosynthesis protein
LKEYGRRDDLEKAEVNIDAFDFLIVILKRKKMILMMLISGVLLSLAYVLYFNPRPAMDTAPTYRSEIVIVVSPDNQDYGRGLNLEDVYFKLKNEIVVGRIFSKCQESDPSDKMTREALIKAVDVTGDAGKHHITIAIEAKIPQTSQRLIDCFALQMEGVLKETVLHDLTLRQSHLREQCKSASELEQKSLRARLILLEERKFMVESMKLFEVVKPPVAPVLKKPRTKILNSPGIAIAFIMLLMLLLAVVLSFALEYFHNLKEQEPEKLRRIRSLLRFRD